MIDARSDDAAWQSWTGRSTRSEDLLSAELARRFVVTVDDREPGPFAHGAPAPTGIHWCIAPPAYPSAMLGPDGHPALGVLLPPVPFRRRMWAGGRLEFVRAFTVGSAVWQKSTIASITVKEGRSGRLCFVVVEHEYGDAEGTAVRERQDIVYRDPVRLPAAAAPQAEPAAGPRTDELAAFDTTTTMLFRYSALTFNGHRIHYDLAYATNEEEYAGLVVHGPLQATWMLRLAERMRNSAPSTFTFRGLQPLICGERASVAATEGENGALELVVRNSLGVPTMSATATWN